jgi:P pilus assembly chaperone PapD
MEKYIPMEHQTMTLIWFYILAGIVLSIGTASAMTVKPMVKEISTTGRTSQYAIHIDNPSAKSLTIEMITTRISMTKKGKETRTPADGDLLIIPVTAIIPPGKSQTIMVQYIGAPQLKESHAYRVSIKQAAIDLSGSGKPAIGIGVNFNTLLNVVPAKAIATLKLKSLKRSGKNWLMELENSGNRYARISKTQWTITDKSGAKRQLTGKDVKKYLDGNLILPNSSRVFSMTPTPTLKPENISNIAIQANN